MSPKYDRSSWLRLIASTSGVLVPGLHRRQGREDLQCLLTVSTSTSSIFVAPYLAHRAIFIIPADCHENPQGRVVTHDY